MEILNKADVNTEGCRWWNLIRKEGGKRISLKINNNRRSIFSPRKTILNQQFIECLNNQCHLFSHFSLSFSVLPFPISLFTPSHSNFPLSLLPLSLFTLPLLPPYADSSPSYSAAPSPSPPPSPISSFPVPLLPPSLCCPSFSLSPHCCSLALCATLLRICPGRCVGPRKWTCQHDWSYSLHSMLKSEQNRSSRMNSIKSKLPAYPLNGEFTEMYNIFKLPGRATCPTCALTFSRCF